MRSGKKEHVAYDDLHEYLETLENRGELHRVKAEVDPLLEIAEITGRVSKSPDGRALLFERVRGGTLPVVTKHVRVVAENVRGSFHFRAAGTDPTHGSAAGIFCIRLS